MEGWALSRPSLQTQMPLRGIPPGELRSAARSVKCHMRYLLAAFLLLVLPSVNAESKFDFATTPGKLPKEVRPSEYAIRIEPNLDKLRFTGSETVQLQVDKPVTKLVLNALEMEIASASIDGKPLPEKAIVLNAGEQTLTLNLPNELPAGAHELALKFSGKINPQGQGLFYARYREEGTNEKKIMLGTQFEATDARRMFPCWDEPVFRARFQLTAVVPKNFMAVSNMPIEEEKEIKSGKEVRFALTPSMSSYLVVLCAGELEAIESEQDGVKLRVIATKGKVEMGRYALESEAKDSPLLQRVFWRALSAPQARLDRDSGRFRRRDGKLGRHHLLRVHSAFRSEEFLRQNAAGYFCRHRARDGASMVWRSRHDGVVG